MAIGTSWATGTWGAAVWADDTWADADVGEATLKRTEDVRLIITKEEEQCR